MTLTQVTTGGVDENINIDSNTLKVDGANNRVGIGTAAPIALLDVNGQARFGGNKVTLDTDGSISGTISNSTTRALVLSNTNVNTDYFGGRVIQIGPDGTVDIGGSAGTSPSSYSSPNIKINPAGSSYINGGSVGIGISSPESILHVVKNSTNNTPLSHNYPATQSGLFVSNNQTGTTGAFSAVTLRAYNSNGAGQSASIIAQSTGSGNAPSLLFTQRSGSGTNSEGMRLDSSGRLLVGTTAASSSGGGKLVTRNDVDYTSTEFEDNATLVVQNETNNNSAAIVFHSNNSTGSSGRAAIVGGTVNNGKGKLGFYGSCMNKNSSTDADVTIDAGGRLLVGVTSARHNDAYLENYRASGQNYIWVETNDIGNGQYSMYRAQASVSGSQTRQAWIGVHKHSGITNPCAFAFLEAEDGANVYLWHDNSNQLRNSTSPSHVGTTNGNLIGAQTSDLRLKNVGANVSYGLAEVKQLQPKQYALKDDPDVNKLGFIAQEVESIIPEAVFDTNEELDGHQEGDRTKLGMEYVQLIPVLVNAIKELSAEVDTLKTKVAALEAAA